MENNNVHIDVIGLNINGKMEKFTIEALEFIVGHFLANMPKTEEAELVEAEVVEVEDEHN